MYSKNYIFLFTFLSRFALTKISHKLSTTCYVNDIQSKKILAVIYCAVNRLTFFLYTDVTIFITKGCGGKKSYGSLYYMFSFLDCQRPSSYPSLRKGWYKLANFLFQFFFFGPAPVLMSNCQFYLETNTSMH